MKQHLEKFHFFQFPKKKNCCYLHFLFLLTEISDLSSTNCKIHLRQSNLKNPFATHLTTSHQSSVLILIMCFVSLYLPFFFCSQRNVKNLPIVSLLSSFFLSFFLSLLSSSVSSVNSFLPSFFHLCNKRHVSRL